MIAERGDDAPSFGDDPAGHDGAAGDLGDVRLAFCLIGIQQRIRCVPAEHCGQLPAQVRRVAHPCGHSLTDPWRHGMGGIAGKKYPSHPPAVGDADVVAVDHGAQYLDVFLRDALVVKELPHRLVGDELLVVLAARAGNSQRWWPSGVGQSTVGRSGLQ